MSSQDVAAVVLAAGAGRRMRASTNKVFLLVGGKPILAWSLELFQKMPQVAEIVLVSAADEVDVARETIIEPFGFSKVRKLVVGGDARHQSEFLGIRALEPEIESGAVNVILVHDAVRPFVSASLVEQLIGEARATGAAIPAVRSDDGVVAVGLDGRLQHPGDNLWVAQTPQAFDARQLLAAHRAMAAQGFVSTDTASVFERAGHAVSVLEGAYENIKITTSDDLVLGEQIARRQLRVGVEQGMLHV